MSELERWWNPIPDDVKAQIRAMIGGELNVPQMASSGEVELIKDFHKRQIHAEILADEMATEPSSIPAVQFPPIETVIDGTPSSPIAEWDAAGEKSDID